MLTSNETQTEQSESVEVGELNQRERLVLQMFRQLDPQQQTDIMRFLQVLLNSI